MGIRLLRLVTGMQRDDLVDGRLLLLRYGFYVAGDRIVRDDLAEEVERYVAIEVGQADDAVREDDVEHLRGVLRGRVPFFQRVFLIGRQNVPVALVVQCFDENTRLLQILYRDRHKEESIRTRADVVLLRVVKEGERLIAARFADQDPLSYQTYLREFHLQLAFLYPFVELAIEDPDAWVQALVAYSASGNEEPILRAHQWQERINALVTRLS